VRRTRARTGLYLGAVGLVGLAAIGCREKVGAAPPGRKASAVPVRVTRAAVQDVVYRIQALGSLEPDDLVRVTAQVEGAVKDVSFREGDRVTPETVLLRIDPDRYRLEAERARAVLEQAIADRDRAQADLERREALAENQLVAQEELTRARSETAGLSAAAEMARAAARIAEQDARRAEVRAPRAGVIDTRTVDTGQFVKTGDVLATIVDTRRLRLRFKVAEAESLRARVGETVSFRVPPLGPRQFEGRIYHVGSVADATSRQVEVLAWVDNPGDLKPGFFAEVSLEGERHEAALVVPESAVQASEAGFVVYTVEDDVAHTQPVRVGLRTGTGVVEILEGLKPGETVVTEGSDRLADGVAVQEAAEAPREASTSPLPPGGGGAGEAP
jgi:RND family efflux transporter MFP subunit